MILRALTALAAPAGARSRLSVFYFHRALAEPDPLLPFEPDARMFDRMLGWIGAQFRVLDPMEACDRLFDGTLPSRPAVVTFDDGYRDNFTVALPILQRHGMKAAFFVATGFLEGGAMFNDRVIEAVRHCSGASLRLPGGGAELMLGNDARRRDAIDRILAAIKHLPPDERLRRVLELERAAGVDATTGTMMRPDDVTALHRAGMRVGGHTRTHPILLKLDDAAAEREIRGGLDDLAAIIGERPQLFAYPNGKPGGDFDQRHAAMVERAGARYAFTTQPGAAVRSSGRFLLPRFTPWDRTRWRFGLRAWRNLAGQRPAR
ncbi:MAG: polysaccharide deacetylase family protein [Burkholderiaceae bacterium]